MTCASMLSRLALFPLVRRMTCASVLSRLGLRLLPPRPVNARRPHPCTHLLGVFRPRSVPRTRSRPSRCGPSLLHILQRMPNYGVETTLIGQLRGTSPSSRLRGTSLSSTFRGTPPSSSPWGTSPVSGLWGTSLVCSLCHVVRRISGMFSMACPLTRRLASRPRRSALQRQTQSVPTARLVLLLLLHAFPGGVLPLVRR